MLEARELLILLVPTVFVIGLLVFVVAQTYESRQISAARMCTILGAILFALLLVGLTLFTLSH